MNTHHETEMPELVDGREEIEIERAQEHLEKAREELALVRGEASPEEVEARIRKMSRRSFLWGALAVGATVGGFKWLGTRRAEGGVPWPLRRGFQNNEEFWRDFYKTSRLAPTFPAARAKGIRVNGGEGMSDNFDPKTWKLQVSGLGDDAEFTLDQIKKLPRITMTTELKCIEGWATVVNWSGARLGDFIGAHAPKSKDFVLPDYVGLMTPDGGYYVGLETPAALHPQTLLCYEMNGAPLTLEHGAPLRLVTPIKYGIKNLKRIGTMTFTDVRPADFWAERGYDYYSGF